MVRKNNKLHFALVGLLTIALSGRSLHAAAGDQVALTAELGRALSLFTLGGIILAQSYSGLMAWFSSTDSGTVEQLFDDMAQSAGSMDTQLLHGPVVDVVNHIAQQKISLFEGEGFEALELAIKGKAEPLQALLIAGADVNVVCQFGSTPLMWAVREGRADIVRLLLQAGADLEVVDNYGHTALTWAVIECQVKIVQILLDAGVKVDVVLESFNQGDVKEERKYIIRMLIDAQKERA